LHGNINTNYFNKREKNIKIIYELIRKVNYGQLSKVLNITRIPV